jgi:predicted anti-sigma-YlaC factor YlaD
MAFNQLLAMVEAIFTSHEDEVDCEGCDAEMPHLVELIDAGEDPALLLPAVQEHLNRCRDCREEFEALLAIIKAENAGLLAEEGEETA